MGYLVWIKPVLVVFVFLTLTSCVVYTEKQSEALSQAVYLAEDSFELGRFDVTDVSLDETVRLVKPPKIRIEINSLEKSQSVQSTNNSAAALVKPNKERVIVVPSRFKNLEVVVVGTVEYERLMQDQKIFNQLQLEHIKLKKLKNDVDEEIKKQQEMNNKMVIELNECQKALISKNLLILRLQITIVLLIAAIGGGIYLRMKGIL
jgi:hypothetical protein